MGLGIASGRTRQSGRVESRQIRVRLAHRRHSMGWNGIASRHPHRLARCCHILDWQTRYAVGLGWQFGSVTSVEWPPWPERFEARVILAPAAESSVSEAEPEARGGYTIPREIVQAPSAARRQWGIEVVNGLMIWSKVGWGVMWMPSRGCVN